MSEDPWRNLAPPKAANAFSARRVDAEAPHDFFWARDIDGNCLLALYHAPESSPGGRLPGLKGMEVAELADDEGGRRLLLLRLLESSHRDIFHHLCLDIMHSAAEAASEREAVAITLQRVWRWHHLLRGGGSARLSEEEQKGLVGELQILRKLFPDPLTAFDAVNSWLGPTGAPKDFEVGKLAIESKARRGGSRPFIAISSEFQLDDAGFESLFLHVITVDRVASDDEKGRSLHDLATEVRGAIEATDPSALEIFESRLLAAGFDWADDYADTRWKTSDGKVFRVGHAFPRLTSGSAPSGVSRVRYQISLDECQPYAADFADVTAAITGASDAD
jgi:hypothetical protein